MGQWLWRYVVFLALAFWLGGLTFYAGVVVPIGTAVLGATEQGFVTRQVAVWLNWAGLLAILVLLAEVWPARRPLMKGLWLLILAIQIALFALHPRVEGLLDLPGHSVPDHEKFYAMHRVYLVLVTLQWIAGGVMAARVVAKWTGVTSRSLPGLQ